MFNRSMAFGKSFNSGKCKTLLRLAISRIKLLRNKRDTQLKQMKRDLSQLLQSKQDLTAQIRVEHVYREQNVMATYEIIELFCELLVVRLPIIESQRLCPIDLKEAVASLAFAAPRCAELPELQQISSVFASKYGKDFISAAVELRPECGVNRLVIEKLSLRAPSHEVKVKLMREIAAEHGVDWDAKSLEAEISRLPQDLLNGADRFSMDQTTRQVELKNGAEEDELDIDLPDLGDLIRTRSSAATSESQRNVTAIEQNKPIKPRKSVSFASSSLPIDDKGEDEDSGGDGGDCDSSHDHHSRLDINKKKPGKDYNRSDVVNAAREAAQSAERAAAAAIAATTSLAKASRNTGKESWNAHKHSYSSASSTEQSLSASEEDEEDREENREGRGRQSYKNVHGFQHWQPSKEQPKEQSEEYFRIGTDSFNSHILRSEPTTFKSPIYDDGDENVDWEEMNQHNERRNAYSTNVSNKKPVFDEDPNEGLEHCYQKRMNGERMHYNTKKSHGYRSDHFNTCEDDESTYEQYDQKRLSSEKMHNMEQSFGFHTDSFSMHEDEKSSYDKYDQERLSRERMHHNTKKSHESRKDCFNMSDDDEPSYDDVVDRVDQRIGNFNQRYSPPKRAAPPLPSSAKNSRDNMACHVHPKLPDYDDLTARFEALRSSRQ